MQGTLKKVGLAVAVAGVFAAGAAQATTIAGGLVNGFNLVIDESREAFIDNPGGTPNGTFGVGDVIVGYIKISDFNTKGVSANNQVYGIFSQQVTGVVGGSVTFGATTVAGLRLSDITGCSSCANGIFALYDRTTPYPVDLVNASPGGATTMKDYTDFIKNNGTLELVGGFDLGFPSDFLTSFSSFAGAPTSSFIGLPSSVAVASTGAALSITTNNTGFKFVPDVLSVSAPGYTPLLLAASSLGVSGGAVSGSGGASPSPQAWLSAAGYGAFTQCLSATSANTPCGFIDKNNFNVDVIPEPTSMALFGAALLAGGAGWLRRRPS